MADKKSLNAGLDYMIFVPVILLLCMGLVILYSASSQLAADKLGDSYFYLKRQTLFCVSGIVLMMTAKSIPYRFYSKLTYALLGISLVLLIILFIPGLGYEVGGASRWLRLGGLSFQPSELAKFSLALYMAYSMAKKGSDMGFFTVGLLPNLIIAGTFMGLIILEPDLGTTVIIGLWILIFFFVGGARLYQLVLILIVFTPIVAWFILHAEYRLKRWWAFINPWNDPQGFGFQIIHSFLAFGSGGFFGVGLGNSKQKLYYLPEAHTDFILSIAAEELGYIGITCIICMFGLVIMRGIKVSLSAPDLYSSYLAFGLTAMFGLQVLINMAVVMGLLPTKGLSLPLISYGGSSMVINLIGIGILLGISSKR
ncbi:MAG: putative lipid II flippase FtsW [Desulfobacteraceae bacterium 4484_190.1]|nr:MAG: putative lipid II flippase FtsW [Desulfobacteraceae bacterium 4484_190.1]